MMASMKPGQRASSVRRAVLHILNEEDGGLTASQLSQRLREAPAGRCELSVYQIRGFLARHVPEVQKTPNKWNSGNLYWLPKDCTVGGE